MKKIDKLALINAPRAEVWKDWTDSARITTFFSPKAAIELKIGGKFEMYFNLEAPYGSQGSEDCKVLSYVPEKMLSFSWNAPPHLPNVRKERTWVVLEFIEMNDFHTKVALTHLGWGEGDEWDAAYDYFQNAWSIVLKRLEEKYGGKEEEE